MNEMSRGEMIRRLDEASREVHDRMENGPLSTEERHTLAASLTRLLPIVAETLQDEEDANAAKALLRHREPIAAGTGGRRRTRPPSATTPAFRAAKPILTTHPVNGGDALMFAITPPPPQSWWRAMRHHVAANPLLVQPWNPQHDHRIAIECPSPDRLSDVIAAIDDAVARSNADHARELTLQRGAAEERRPGEGKRERDLGDIQHALDEHYDTRTSAD